MPKGNLSWQIGWMLGCGLVLGGFSPPSQALAPPYLDCEIAVIPPETHSGSGYTAIEVGQDGRVYVGTAWYGDYGYLLALDPGTRQFHIAASIWDIVRENLGGGGINSQSKTHTKLVVDKDGIVYGGTKQGNEIFDTRPEIGEDPHGYPGGHLYSYNPRTGCARDLGILKAQDGLMNGCYDPVRQRLYYKTEPRTHFLIYDLATGKTRDLGRVGSWARYMAINAQGEVYFPTPEGIVKYDPVSDRLYDLAVAVVGEGPPYRQPYGICMGPDGTRLYGGDTKQLMEFDLTSATATTVSMRYVMPSVPAGYQPGDIHTMVLGKDRCIYWTHECAPEAGGKAEVHVMRYDPATGTGEDCGALRVGSAPDTDVTGIQGSAVGEDGTLYLMKISNPYAILIVPRLTAGG